MRLEALNIVIYDVPRNQLMELMDGEDDQEEPGSKAEPRVVEYCSSLIIECLTADLTNIPMVVTISTPPNLSHM
jgi:hypothetical protein